MLFATKLFHFVLIDTNLNVYLVFPVYCLYNDDNFDMVDAIIVVFVTVAAAAATCCLGHYCIVLLWHHKTSA